MAGPPPQWLGEIVSRLAEAAASNPARDFEKNAKAVLSSAFAKLELVTREETGNPAGKSPGDGKLEIFQGPVRRRESGEAPRHLQAVTGVTRRIQIL